MHSITVILLILYVIMIIVYKYDITIDIVTQEGRYKVLLWYTTCRPNYPNKPIVVRNYIQLFII